MDNCGTLVLHTIVKTLDFVTLDTIDYILSLIRKRDNLESVAMDKMKSYNISSGNYELSISLHKFEGISTRVWRTFTCAIIILMIFH
jgi:hypothetical protein